MRRTSTLLAMCIVLWGTVNTLLNAQGQDRSVNRNPAFAGSFYPANKQALTATLSDLFSAAEPAQLEGKVQSLIVPHAGYVYSGKVAASGYKSIPADTKYSNIFIIASSHREHFNGASIYTEGNYVTPLGEARVNQEIANTLIQKHRSISYNERAHDREHSVEVQVPFLQYYFEDTPPIVPIVMGSSSLSAARDLASALLPYFVPENLFVVSSDFSHYPDYKNANRIDGITGEAILKNDPKHFYNILQKNSREPVQNLATPSCGWSSIMTLLYMSERRENMHMTPVLYMNSGDSPVGDKDQVVGYWAIAGHESPINSSNYSLNGDDRTALLDIARETLVSYLEKGKIPNIQEGSVPHILKQPAGAFVSLYMGGRLRGCIGNFSPETPLYQVVQEMTLAAAVRDSRFAPVETTELKYIDIEISVLTPLQKISSIDEFELGRHGIYMIKNGRSGTYLPQVAASTGWNKEDLLGHCAREKAGIGWEGWKEADLYVYEAIVFGEEKTQ